MNEPHDDPDWQARLGGSSLPPADAGFTLRVLSALPRARPLERLRARVLLAAVLLAAVVMAVTVMPALADPPRLLPALLMFVGGAALALWSVITVAD
jgi:hypothetical protein